MGFVGCGVGWEILCSDPNTNVAVDNIASRPDRITRSVYTRYNDGRPAEDPQRARHRLIVRGHNRKLEKNACIPLLRDPENDLSAPKWKARKNPWRLELSGPTGSCCF
jgi:hypothetical protein